MSKLLHSGLQSMDTQFFSNVKLLDTEIDIVAIKECRNKYIVKIVEVKSLPKRKLIQQIHARTCITHYIYAGLPAEYKEWALRKLPYLSLYA